MTTSAITPATAVAQPVPVEVQPDRGIPPVIKRNLLFIAFAQMLVGVGTQLTPALGAVMAVRLLGNNTFAGLATSLLGLSRLMVSYPVGMLTDRYGRKAGLVAGLLVAILGAVITGFSMLLTSFPLWVAGIFTFGCGVGGIQQLRVAAADMFPPSRRAEGVGILLTGSMVGSFGGTGLVSAANWLGPQWQMDPMALAWMLAPVTFLPALLLVMFIRPDPRQIAANLKAYYPWYTPPAKPAAGAPPVKVGFRAFVREYPKLATFVCSFFVQGNMTMMMSLTALQLDHHGHDLPSISFAVAVHVAGMFMFSLPLGKLTDRIGRKPVMLGGVITAVIGTCVVAATGDYWIVLAGAFLFGLGWSGVNVAATVLLSDTTPPEARGRAVGTNDSLASAAHLSMPILGGILAQAFGIQSAAFAAAVFAMIPAVFLLRVVETSPGRFPQSPYPAPE